MHPKSQFSNWYMWELHSALACTLRAYLLPKIFPPLHDYSFSFQMSRTLSHSFQQSLIGTMRIVACHMKPASWFQGHLCFQTYILHRWSQATHIFGRKPYPTVKQSGSENAGGASKGNNWYPVGHGASIMFPGVKNRETTDNCSRRFCMVPELSKKAMYTLVWWMDVTLRLYSLHSTD